MASLTGITFTDISPVIPPLGNFAERLLVSTGEIRYNSEANAIEHSDGTNWIQLNPVGRQVFGFTGANQTLTIPA